jgi:hypothetical protein
MADEVNKSGGKRKVVVFAETYIPKIEEVEKLYKQSELSAEAKEGVRAYKEINSFIDKQSVIADKRLSAARLKHENKLMEKGEPSQQQLEEGRDALNEEWDKIREDYNKAIEPYRKKAYDVQSAFYKSQGWGLEDKMFSANAENIKAFYAKKDPNVEVIIHKGVAPTYGDETGDNNKERAVANEKLFADNVKDLSPSDEVVILGHAGNSFLGVKSEKLAKYIKDSKVDNVYLGTCALPDKLSNVGRGNNPEVQYKNNVEPFEKTGKNIYYKPRVPDVIAEKNIESSQYTSFPSSWYGFNRNAKSFIEGMYGVKDSEGNQFSKLEEGVHYSNTKTGVQKNPLLPSDRVLKAQKNPNFFVVQSAGGPQIPPRFGAEPITWR